MVLKAEGHQGTQEEGTEGRHRDEKGLKMCFVHVSAPHKRQKLCPADRKYNRGCAQDTGRGGDWERRGDEKSN